LTTPDANPMSVAPDSDIHDAGNVDGNMPVQMPLVCADARLVFNACQVLDDVLCSAHRRSKGSGVHALLGYVTVSQPPRAQTASDVTPTIALPRRCAGLGS
jgi:hypothetical protein